ncbi:MAG: hypothetical protein VB082_08125 [Christensenella sp.]|nr:hypothetical protein [Christensenella sp.]
MARKRMIDPNIWQSEDFARLSVLARLVFIGLFSNADDEGRGRAKPMYVKSNLFPYDEDMRVTDIEKSLSEIAAFLSITFYTADENQYYSLDHWKGWQRVDKPQPSKIPPPPPGKEEEIPGTLGDPSGNARRTVAPNRKEENRTEGNQKETGFAAPSEAEVAEYCISRSNNVDADAFFDFYESKGWYIGKNKMKDWRACVRSWEKKARIGTDRRGFEQREYSPQQQERRKKAAMDELEQLYGNDKGEET